VIYCHSGILARNTFPLAKLSSRYISFEAIEGAYERMVTSSPLLALARRLRLLQYIVWKKELTYVEQTLPDSTFPQLLMAYAFCLCRYISEADDGRKEQFERILVHFPSVRLAMRLYFFVSALPLVGSRGRFALLPSLPNQPLLMLASEAASTSGLLGATRVKTSRRVALALLSAATIAVGGWLAYRYGQRLGERVHRYEPPPLLVRSCLAKRGLAVGPEA
jgi:hypothetical protein